MTTRLTSSPSMARLTTFVRKLARPEALGFGLFWAWNAIFLAFMLLGFAPVVLPEMIRAVRGGNFPAAFLVYALLLTLIPVLAVLLALTRLRRSPGRLFALGYGVEGPLMILVAVRFFAVRELMQPVALLLAVAALGIGTFLWQLLDPGIDRRGAAATVLRAVGLTLLVLVGLYFSLWIAFYIVPLAAAILAGLGEMLAGWRQALADFWTALVTFDWRQIFSVDFIRMAPFMILGSILTAFTAALFIAMPVVVSWLYLRAWWRGLRTLAARLGRAGAVTVPALVVAAVAALIIVTNRQPQHTAFALLDRPPADAAAARALLDRADEIRAGLLNAYLAPQRYFSAVGEVRHIRDLYRDSALKLSDPRAARVQAWYEAVARPILYVPVHPPQAEADASLAWDNRAFREEPMEAAELYARFFDRPIDEAERPALVRAARSTWSVDQAEAAWEAVDDREVHLLRQDVTVAEHGDWAEVELYEVYQNRTPQRQEVVYYFNLPESAVVTGVWLGASADRAGRSAFRVAPRGAAQALYREEVRRRVDPALVEQIGPRQYRLRAFPIEPERPDWTAGSERMAMQPGPPLHLWLTYRVLAAGDAWPLPRLAEKRNVFWDAATERTVGGHAIAGQAEDWLPASVPATAPVQPQAHRVDFPNGETVIVRPVGADPAASPWPLDDLHLDIVLDRSRSMAAHADEVAAALAELREQAHSYGTPQVYLTASEFRGEAPSHLSLGDLDPASILYFGGQNAAELLAEYAAMAGEDDTEPDAIVVLTDGSGYELAADDIAVPGFDAPVWLVHLGDALPIGYDDATMEAIQASGGGIAGSVAEVRARLGASAGNPPDTIATDVIDGYVWETLPTDKVQGAIARRAQTTVTQATKVSIAGGQVPPQPDAFAAAAAELDPTFGPLAARRVILSAMRQARGAVDRLASLNALHAIAQDQKIVTPYSSMIVLVNIDQERRLDALEQQSDRFDREIEAIGDTNPNTLQVTGVPEPEEWLLLALAAAMLGWYGWRRRGDGGSTAPG